jgi:hypothetical protein
MILFLDTVFHRSLLVVFLHQKLIILHFNITQLRNILLFRLLEPPFQLSITLL